MSRWRALEHDTGYAASSFCIIATYLWIIRRQRAELVACVHYSVSIFDQNIIRSSPAGSCVLRIVEELSGDVPLHLFSNRADCEGTSWCALPISFAPGPVVCGLFYSRFFLA